MKTLWMVYHQSADSYLSVPQPPLAVFDDEQIARQFASKQDGYGLDIDWFVKEIKYNPPIEKVRR